MFTANEIGQQTYRSFEPLITAAALYFMIAFPASVIASRLERNMLKTGNLISL
jgi:polar amino acid transport system permease protein